MAHNYAEGSVLLGSETYMTKLRLTSMHVPGVENGAADAISRDRLDMFFGLVHRHSGNQCRSPRSWYGVWWWNIFSVDLSPNGNTLST